MKRTLLARASGVATRQRTFAIPDGLEIDEADHYEVRRTRVLYDDVILVTYHRYRGLWFFIFMAVLAAIFVEVSWLLWREEHSVGLWMGATTVLPILLIIAIRAILGIDEINVYGRRSRARMRFLFRKARAREVLDQIRSAVERVQQPQ